MNKEELINFINGIDFELATNLEITYCKKKPRNSSYLSGEDRYDMERKTITFNKDFENLLNERTNWIDRRIDDLYKGIQQIEERIKENEKGN